MKKKKYGLFFGISSIKSSFSMVSQIINDNKKEKEKESIKETFDEALLRLNIPKEDRQEFLRNKYNSIKNASIVNYMFTVIIMAYFIYTFNNAEELPLIHFLPFIMAIYFTMQGFFSAFRCYQIELEELVSLRSFITKPKKWFVLNQLKGK